MLAIICMYIYIKVCVCMILYEYIILNEICKRNIWVKIFTIYMIQVMMMEKKQINVNHLRGIASHVPIKPNC